jgi:hypothetical protein
VGNLRRPRHAETIGRLYFARSFWELSALPIIFNSIPGAPYFSFWSAR